jgi:hypothetical protein
MPTSRIAVGLETTPKKCFAAALDWPGWCRSGRDADAALEALADYADRFGPVAAAAGFPLPPTIALQEVERCPGGATTSFGAPEVTFDADRRALSAAEAKRIAALLGAAWDHLDDVAARTPEALRKGPRGGGRDRDKMIDHVLGAENAYARKIGVKVPVPGLGDTAAIDAQRQAILVIFANASDGSPMRENGWTARYAARRAAWHVLDHLWEMEDRAEPSP